MAKENGISESEYEDKVNKFSNEVYALILHCGLKWEDIAVVLLNFYQNIENKIFQNIEQDYINAYRFAQDTHGDKKNGK